MNRQRPLAIAPTPADAAAATGKEPAKAYLAPVAIRSGDKPKIMDLSPPDKRAMIDTPEFPQMLKMVQMMTHQNLQVLQVSEHGITPGFWRGAHWKANLSGAKSISTA